jgi:uncharacterized membrane-anchored protein
MGEAISDYVVASINPIFAVGLGALGLGIALYIQFSSKVYTPWKYWLAVSMVAVFGTMAADVVHIGLGVPYIYSSIFFAVVLTIVFITWYKKEKTLSIHSITTIRREIFYWLAVISTFALGTATGDLTASTLRLGYFVSVLVFLVLILVPLVAYFTFGLREVIAFWVAYILTRPLGASFADWFGKSRSVGGLGVGDGVVGLVLIIAIIVLVLYTSRQKKVVFNSSM